MSGVFDRLSKQLGDVDTEGGITALDLAELPPPLRKIMRLMLREVEMTYPDLCKAVAEMDDPDRLSQAELDEALDMLSKQYWLLRMGVEEKITYRVNLRRKAGSSLAKNIWASLDAKIAQSSGQTSSTES